MITYIAFFRGINVGGKNILPMKALAEILAGLGLTGIRTYIQSGNAVFRSPKRKTQDLAREIQSAVGEDRGFEPQVIVISLAELRAAVAANPFPAGESEPKSLHLFFLESVPPNPDLARLADLEAETEQHKLVDSVFYLHAPDGIAPSKLARNVEKALGVPVTARNWRTAQAALSLASSDTPGRPEETSKG